MTGDGQYVVYMLRTSKNTLYVGQTNNLEKRLAMHKKGKGSKYMRSFPSFAVVYREHVPSLSDALKREHELKQLSHEEKEKLIALQIKE